MLRKFLWILVLITLVFGVTSVCFAEVPKQDIMLLADDSSDILATWRVAMSYNDWKPLYTKLAKDEGRFTARYPNSEYKDTLAHLMADYDIVSQGFSDYIKITNSGNDKDKAIATINRGFDSAKIHHSELLKIIELQQIGNEK